MANKAVTFYYIIKEEDPDVKIICDHGLNIKTHQLIIHNCYTCTKGEVSQRYDSLMMTIKKSIKKVNEGKKM